MFFSRVRIDYHHMDSVCPGWRVSITETGMNECSPKVDAMLSIT